MIINKNDGKTYSYLLPFVHSNKFCSFIKKEQNKSCEINKLIYNVRVTESFFRKYLKKYGKGLVQLL